MRLDGRSTRRSRCGNRSIPPSDSGECKSRARVGACGREPRALGHDGNQRFASNRRHQHMLVWRKEAVDGISSRRQPRGRRRDLPAERPSDLSRPIHPRRLADTTDIGRGRTVAGLTEIIGRVELLHCSYALLLQRASEGPRQSTGFKLQLGDGRWVNVAITSPDGTVTALGTIRGTRRSSRLTRGRRLRNGERSEAPEHPPPADDPGPQFCGDGQQRIQDLRARSGSTTSSIASDASSTSC
jgi:hypothetical protein